MKLNNIEDAVCPFCNTNFCCDNYIREFICEKECQENYYYKCVLTIDSENNCTNFLFWIKENTWVSLDINKKLFRIKTLDKHILLTDNLYRFIFSEEFNVVDNIPNTLTELIQMCQKLGNRIKNIDAFL